VLSHFRNNDDGMVAHQNAEYGQDNWLYARIRNKSTTHAVKHFLVTFNAKSFAGTEFVYPNDFMPSINAAAGFDLQPSASTIVKARWPAANVPPAGTHSCLLAAIIARSAHPVDGRHVWEHNNLAQKNLTIVDLVAGDFIIVPFIISNFSFGRPLKFKIELRKDKAFPADAVAIIHQPEVFNRHQKIHSIPLHEHFQLAYHKDLPLDCGAHLHINSRGQEQLITSANIESFSLLNRGAVISEMQGRKIPSLLTELKPNDQVLLALKVEIPKTAKAGSVHRFDVVQRNDRTNKIIGGIALEIRVKEK
jgi:hypothetical protein